MRRIAVLLRIRGAVASCTRPTQFRAQNALVRWTLLVSLQLAPRIDFRSRRTPLVTARAFAPSKGPPRSSQAQLICSAAREADDWVLSRAATRRPVAQEVCLHGQQTNQVLCSTSVASFNNYDWGRLTAHQPSRKHAPRTRARNCSAGHGLRRSNKASVQSSETTLDAGRRRDH